MINKDVPCTECKHAAIKHYTNISDEETLCVLCMELDYGADSYHSFIGNNLKFMELMAKKKELKNGNNL